MKNEDFSEKPLVEQVYDELFADIEKIGEFDEVTIKTLKQLAASDELKKAGKVTDAIKIRVAKGNETAGTGN